jgi:hypothetical protein
MTAVSNRPHNAVCQVHVRVSRVCICEISHWQQLKKRRCEQDGAAHVVERGIYNAPVPTHTLQADRRTQMHR